MCECMDILVKEIEKKYPGKYHNLETPSSINFMNSEVHYNFNLYYKKKKKNGDMIQKQFELPIQMTYCPLCGAEYNPKEAPCDNSK